MNIKPAKYREVDLLHLFFCTITMLAYLYASTQNVCMVAGG